MFKTTSQYIIGWCWEWVDDPLREKHAASAISGGVWNSTKWSALSNQQKSSWIHTNARRIHQAKLRGNYDSGGDEQREEKFGLINLIE